MTGDEPAGWAALGELYHRYLTGLLLALVSRHGSARATEVVFQTFRRQHLEQFLPGLRKLELDDLSELIARQRRELDDLVDPVQELRPEEIA